MTTRRAFLLSSIAVLAACGAPALPTFDAGRVLLQHGGELHVVWEIADAPALFLPAVSASPTLARYLDAVRARVDVSQASLLERQSRHYLTGDPVRRGEGVNGAWVLAHRERVVTKAAAIDLALLALQAERFPMLERPTEFGAFLVAKGGVLRVYASSVDRPGGKFRREVTGAVLRDVQSGWTLRAHLHNHNFDFTHADIGGGVAPSMTDVQWYRAAREEFGLPRARITNGFDTAEIPAEVFDELAGWS